MVRQDDNLRATCGLVEVKLGGESLIDEGAATLNALSGLVDTSR